MPDNSPPELKDSFDALLAPLLLNSALAAIRIQPASHENAKITVTNSTRALDRLNLNTADKGTTCEDIKLAVTLTYVSSQRKLFIVEQLHTAS